MTISSDTTQLPSTVNGLSVVDVGPRQLTVKWAMPETNVSQNVLYYRATLTPLNGSGTVAQPMEATFSPGDGSILTSDGAAFAADDPDAVTCKGVRPRSSASVRSAPAASNICTNSTSP